MTIEMVKWIWLFIYYLVARNLPSSHCKWFKWGNWARTVCCKHVFKKCDSTANIERGVSFGTGRYVEIGYRSGLGGNCHVPNDIIIGENVMIGPNCFFLDNITHEFSRTDIPMIDQGIKKTRRTIVGNDVWIGRQCIIIGGKRIGNHCVIGAGSVVSKDVPDYAVAAGNPIKIIRDRRK